MKLIHKLNLAASTLLTLTSLSGFAKAADNFEFPRMAYKRFDGVDLASNKALVLYTEVSYGILTKDDVVNMALGDPARRPFLVNSIYQRYLHRPASAFDLAYWGTGQQNWTSEMDLRSAVIATDEFFYLPCNNFIGNDSLRNFVCNVGNAVGETNIFNFIESNVGKVTTDWNSRRQFAALHLVGVDGGANYCRERMWEMVVYQGDFDSLFQTCRSMAAAGNEEGATYFLAHSARFYQDSTYYK